MIEVKDLCFSYGDHEVLRDMSFTIPEKRLVAVLGVNGAGKSTLFKCMLGLLKGYTGSILLDDRDIRSLSRSERASKIGYVPQNEKQIYNYTVTETVLMGMAHTIHPISAPKKEHLDKAEEVMERMGIAHLASRGINEISGGERQLALLARVIAQDSEILIMDEPTANLDYGHQHQVMMMIKHLAEQGYTILLSTHNPEHAVMYATDVMALKDRRLLVSGKNEDVMTDELIDELYGLPVRIADNPYSESGGRVCIPGW